MKKILFLFLLLPFLSNGQKLIYKSADVMRNYTYDGSSDPVPGDIALILYTRANGIEYKNALWYRLVSDNVAPDDSMTTIIPVYYGTTAYAWKMYDSIRLNGVVLPKLGTGNAVLNGIGSATNFSSLFGSLTMRYVAGLASMKVTTAAGDSMVSNSVAIGSGKRVETYSGTTNGSGVYTVTFGTAYSVAPNIQASLSNQSAVNQFIKVTSVSTTGFTINVFSRNSITLLGADLLLSTTGNVSGATVDVLVTEK